MFCKVRKVGSTDLSILLQPLHIYIEVDQVALEGCGDVNFFGWMMVAILQETPIFHGKLHGFRMIPLNIFPTSTNSLINREQFPSQNPIYFFFHRWLGRFLASLGRRTGSMFWGELISLSENIWKQKTFPGAKSFESEAFDSVWQRLTLLRDYSIGECDPTWHNM